MTDTRADDSAITFIIPGVRQEGLSRGGLGPRSVGSGSLSPLDWEVKDSVRVESRRAGGETHRIIAKPGREVVVFTIENGPSLVLHPDSARDLLMAQSAKARGLHRSATGEFQLEMAPREVEVSPQLQWQGLANASIDTQGGTRGLFADVVLKAVDVLGLKENAQEMAAEMLARRLDGRVTEGVYKLHAETFTSLQDQKSLEMLPPAPPGAASLVFVHGTFSTTFESGFANLWGQHADLVDILFQHYNDRVYALDHATLGRSPIENALTLARACPKGTVLHLITHSRGGLVAEVLARAANLTGLDAAAERHFSGEHWQGQKGLLKELIAVMHSNAIKVDRIVRVACPARGTLLASQRLDAYVSVLRWALSLAGVPVVPELVDFLAGVARERTDPSTLPGLAVMAPDSPLIRWLHDAEEVVPGELRVVAGDLQGSNVGSWVKGLMADAFFWTDNDLVVQTRSMYGGAPRAAGATYVLDRSGATSHFNYFRNTTTAKAIVTGMTKPDPAVWTVIGPLSYAGESSEGMRGARRAKENSSAAGVKPAVFVLPGILGSHLRVNNQRVWLGLRLFNGLAQLEYPDSADRRVEPDGPIGLTYDALMTFLAESHEVIPFSYDWRKPLEEEAKRLGKDVEAALKAREGNGQPVRILAHSMGGLLARAMQIVAQDTWNQWMANEGSRLLMLGTPNEGSWAPMQVLSGDDNFGNTLTAVGAPFQDHKARALMAQFPGFLQLQAGLLDPSLPLGQRSGWQQLAAADLDQAKAWSWWHHDLRQLEEFRWGVPEEEALSRAVNFWENMRSQRDRDLPLWSDKVVMVVGSAPFTTEGYEIGADGLVYREAQGRGDGRVTYRSAMLPGVRTWKLACDHGKLPAYKEAFHGFKELLETGDTKHKALHPFSDTTPSRGVGEPATASQVRRRRPSREGRSTVPRSSDDDLYTLPIEDPTGSHHAPQQSPLAITVHNGHLAFVSHPLMIGHYNASRLTGTEAEVDGLIGGVMKEALEIGCYPDRPGSHQVFINTNTANPRQKAQPDSVIVVGLGEEGKLSATELANSVRMAVLAFAQRCKEGPAGAETPFELWATLLGSGGSGIDAGQAAQMIARGVHAANEILCKQERWPKVGSLHLVELYLDRASTALSALKTMEGSQAGMFAIDPIVSEGEGGERRPLDMGYRGHGYDFISALTGNAASTASSHSEIQYTMDTRRARTELRAQMAQQGLVELLVDQASNAECNDGQIGRTLFKLLVPIELEAALGGASSVVLELDRGSAPIPWEMLESESGRTPDTGHEPWAIRTKLIRKLRLEEFRQQPRDASRDNDVLVIGEPLCTDSRFPRLPGAQREAGVVRDLLQRELGNDRVVAVISKDGDDRTEPSAMTIINKLMERDWRVVHISGHGMLPEAGNPRGVVLSDGLYLGPQEIGMMRVVPELVFVNCCHLAASAKPYNRAKFAASVAEQLIHNGVRCVVAAGWAVDDKGAAIFAETFYDQLLHGQRFIDAIATARKAVWSSNPHNNTWAAYQCYGDPDWVLQSEASDPQGIQSQDADLYAGVVSASALTLVLESLTNKAKFASRQGRGAREANGQALQTQLQELESRFAPFWAEKRGAGEVAQAFARAWEQAKDLDKAMQWCETALQTEDGSAALGTYQKLCNLRARQAWRNVEASHQRLAGARATTPDPARVAEAEVQFQQEVERARTTIDKTTKTLERLNKDLGASMERCNLCGSAQKRLAMVERIAANPKAKDAALKEMKKWYEKGKEMGSAKNLTNVFYPVLNLMATECLLHVGEAGNTFDPSFFAEWRQKLEEKSHVDRDFFSEVGVIEWDIYAALATRNLSTALPQLVRRLEILRQRVNDPMQWASVHEQLDFVLPDYIESIENSHAAEAVAARQLHGKLEAYAMAS
ncbi:MAG: CHAT domain-containing protein [Cyanobacteriota bacterium]